jgi:hypothetical protein
MFVIGAIAIQITRPGNGQIGSDTPSILRMISISLAASPTFRHAVKQAEQTRGVPLTGLAFTVTPGFYLIGLSNVEADKDPIFNCSRNGTGSVSR